MGTYQVKGVLIQLRPFGTRQVDHRFRLAVPITSILSRRCTLRGELLLSKSEHPSPTLLATKTFEFGNVVLLLNRAADGQTVQLQRNTRELVPGLQAGNALLEGKPVTLMNRKAQQDEVGVHRVLHVRRTRCIKV